MDKNSNLVINKRYEVIRSIDEGGTSLIFLVYDNKRNRNCAMKVLKKEFSTDPLYVKAFTSEISRLKRLRSSKNRGIIQIQNYSIQGRFYYYVMDYVEGKTLKTLIEEDSLTFHQKMEISIKLCEAIQSAHSAGVVHGDIKSANVVINSDGEPVILDFGNVDENIGEKGEILGTVEYFSPEQARGEKAEKASDIYSAGVVIYEMFTGHLPFTGDDQTSLALHHMYSLPEFSEEDLDGMNESIHRIILKALRKSRSDRYQSPSRMADDLRKAETDPTGAFVTGFEEEMEEGKVVLKKDRSVFWRRVRHVLYTAVAIPLILLVIYTGIRVYRSLKREEGLISMPNFENIPLKEALEISKEKGFATKISYELSTDMNEDYVISQMPVVGTKLEPGAEIELIVSLGNERGVVMPQLLGISYDLAVERLADLGITNIETRYTYVEGYEDYAVVEQMPLSGDTVPEDSVVILTVSHSREKPAKNVPDLVGHDLFEAGRSASVNGFEHIFISYDEGRALKVDQQYPTADMTEASLRFMRLYAGRPSKSFRMEVPVDEVSFVTHKENHVIITYSIVYEGVSYEFVLDEYTFDGEEGGSAATEKKTYDLLLDNRLLSFSGRVRIYNNYEEVR